MKKFFQYLLDEWLKSFHLEKRDFNRKKISQKVVFIIISRKFPEKTSLQHDAIAYDISERGMSLFVDHLRYDNLHIWKDDSFMDPNYLRLAFHLPKEEKPIEAEAEVVNFSLASPRAIKRYKIGIKFTDISQESLSSIKQFLACK
ncbi:MAG: PilZ domain-containing protein [Candidatus Aureabacteria bacterium]|nr:PilZ domain-containing protein [Candidatus Auribacterota bacterium]